MFQQVLKALVYSLYRFTDNTQGLLLVEWQAALCPWVHSDTINTLKPKSLFCWSHMEDLHLPKAVFAHDSPLLQWIISLRLRLDNLT